jgi:hypothetical protein
MILAICAADFDHVLSHNTMQMTQKAVITATPMPENAAQNRRGSDTCLDHIAGYKAQIHAMAS